MASPGSCEGGGGDNAVVASGHVFARDGLGNVILSASTGAEEGTFRASFSPAVANGVAFLLDGSTLHAVDGAGLGSTDWTFSGDGRARHAPIVAGGVVFVGSSGGNLYALDATTGATGGRRMWGR